MLAFHFTRLGSTNTTARTLALRHPGRVLVVSSQTQTAGRGRLGRPWISPPGGAWFTLAWPVRGDAAATAYDALPLIVGQAILEALDEQLRERGPGPGPGVQAKLEIKWPNDVLLNGRKLAGILCERIMTTTSKDRHGQEAGENAVLLIGVGINVNINPDELGDVRYPAGSLLQVLGSQTPVSEVIARCSQRIASAVQNLEVNGFSAQDARQIEALLAFRGQDLTFRQGDRTLAGRCLGLDEAGRLLLLVDGRMESFAAGEIAGLAGREDPTNAVIF